MEYMDIVNKNDEVIGSASREDIYANSLCHRIAHVLLFDCEGKMILQKRSHNISFCPDHWSTAGGGHVSAGETYEQAAQRELEEEIGVKCNLEFVGKDFYRGDGVPDKFLTTFKSQFDGIFKLDQEEVSDVRSFTINQMKEMIEDGAKFHPELIFILNKYYFKNDKSNLKDR